MKTDTTTQEFFERKYLQASDPWDFTASTYEQQRYNAILHALAHRRYDDAFEAGCSIGVLTARLASLCGRLHAMDISPTAAGYARQRCKHLPNVEITCGALPHLLPPGRFDLVVLSEVGYYFTQDKLRVLGTALTERLRDHGVLLAAHWLGQSEDHILSGDCVHQTLGELNGLVLEHEERHAGFRLARWVRA
jgi:protein-L-isoaspartate O-methyltransferase